MTLQPTHPLSVYLCYAQSDEILKQEFEDYLVILQQGELISGWTERQVQRGADWSRIIDPLIPIILHHVDLVGSPFAIMASLPKNRVAVASWSNRKEAWGNVDQGIRAVINAYRWRKSGLFGSP